MRIQKRGLPAGWYPTSERETQDTLQRFAMAYRSPSPPMGIAGIAPHAGWTFSGDLAYGVVSSLKEAKVFVVAGGHLRARDPILAHAADGFETPLGVLTTSASLRDLIVGAFHPVFSDEPDNTVEVLLPLVKYCFPEAQVVCLRCPPNEQAIQLGKFLADLHRKGKTTLGLLGSTDLTHYGPNYGFYPKGTGNHAVQWVKEENDRGFLKAALSLDPQEVIRHGLEHQSACSAGAAASVVSFAKELGLRGVLIGHSTSWDKHPSSSFVGYGGIIYH